MDIYRDELRRQLKLVDAEHKAAMKPFREALLRIFGKESNIPIEAKAELLRLPAPGRRQFFKIGGATVLGAAILAACGDDNGPIAETGTTQPSDTTTSAPADTTTTTTAATGASDMDIVLLRSATSLELLAVQTYQTAIDSGLVTTPAIGAAATLFQSQHREHAAQLQSATTDAGGQPYDQPNAYLSDNVVAPALAALTDENSVVAFALQLENVAAQTYAFSAGVLSTPAFRQAIMAIGGVEARHAAVLAAVVQPAQQPVPNAFLPTTDRAPDAALITS